MFSTSLNFPNGRLENIHESDSKSSSDTIPKDKDDSVKLDIDTNGEEQDQIKLRYRSSRSSHTKRSNRNAINLEPLTINSGITNAGEAYLFHGTKLGNILSIIEHGFILDHSKEGLYGKGIYLAESSQKADQYADKPDDRRTTFLPMFVVRTSLGRVSMYDPKNKLNESATQSINSGHDSVAVEDTGDTIVAGTKKRFREFIKQDASQCYPEFLIIYDRV